MIEKTNATRLLDAAKIHYELHSYPSDITEGEVVAKLVNKDPEMVFKTLVTVANTKEHFVFCIPVHYALDLKKAASAVGVKSIAMIPQKELLPLTGYIHGGCSPIGTKKQFKTVINDTAMLFETICVSAGKVGLQLELNPEELKNYIHADYADLITDKK